MKALLLLTLISLAHAQADSARPESVIANENECEKGDGLACAKAAYFYKRTDVSLAYKFYEKGCKLNDESACFNMKSINPRALYFKKADGYMHFNAQNISNCYAPKVALKNSTMQYEAIEHKADFVIHINSKGQADNVTITTQLPNEFKECAKKVVKNITFPKPEGIDPVYFYTLTFERWK